MCLSWGNDHDDTNDRTNDMNIEGGTLAMETARSCDCTHVSSACCRSATGGYCAPGTGVELGRWKAQNESVVCDGGTGRSLVDIVVLC